MLISFQNLTAGNPYAKCACQGGVTLEPMTVYMPTIYTQSCDYTALPDTVTVKPAAPTITDGMFNGPSLGPPSKNASSMSLTMGSSSVHVGSLSSSDLSASIATAIASVCPEAQPSANASCSEDKVIIPKIAYVDVNDNLSYGELEFSIGPSEYIGTKYVDEVDQRGKRSCPFRSCMARVLIAQQSC